MKFIPQSISDVILIKPSSYGDERGYFMETFRQDLFKEFLGEKVDFVQDNESHSFKGVLRGLHFQLPPFAQSKLIRVSQGDILDIAVDIRKSSPTFGKHVQIELTSKNKYQLFIPQGFAHGFIVLSDKATISYKVDNFYSLECERGIAFNDEDLGINWIFPSSDIKLANKDKTHPKLSDANDLFK